VKNKGPHISEVRNIISGTSQRGEGLVHLIDALKVWWRDTQTKPTVQELGIESGQNLRRQESPAPTGIVPRDNFSKKELDDDDGFQVQATPPHLSSIKRRDKNDGISEDGGSEADSDDLDAPSQHSLIPDSIPLNAPSQRSLVPDSVPLNASSKATTRQLGAIGGVKKTENNKEPPLERDETPISLSKESKTDDETTTEDEAPSAPTLKVEPVQKVKKTGLGKIGGKKTTATPTPDPEPISQSPEIAPPSSQPSSELPRRGRGLGHIGKRAQIRDSQATQEIVKEEIKEETPPRETSRERADRKREALKRDLEEKAKAPVKKRRRF
jgi:hypothetical protein